MDLNEAYFVNTTCEGIIEYVLPDRARVDCLTLEYAIEYDWDYKWAECIGQSLYYASQTDRKPMCRLIAKRNRPAYIYRFNSATKDVKLEVIPYDDAKTDR